VWSTWTPATSGGAPACGSGCTIIGGDQNCDAFAGPLSVKMRMCTNLSPPTRTLSKKLVPATTWDDAESLTTVSKKAHLRLVAVRLELCEHTVPTRGLCLAPKWKV